MVLKLSNAALGALPTKVAAPGYDRSALKSGILHVGVGNFHRAHQAVYLDDLFGRGLDHDWAILGAGIMPGDAAMREVLAAQDWLNTVVELEPGAHTARVTGAMTGFVPVTPGHADLIAAMTVPETRIVSLTVTEGGYFIDAATEAFDPGHPDILHDAANPDTPRTVFGAIIAALRARRDAGTAPFTVLSCDNLPGNGHVAQGAVAGLARISDPGIADWIEANVAFPNGMVDRITPATGDRERAMVRDEFGIEDAAPVFCEPFRQWVLEDNFPTGRPALEEVGVTFTDQVEAFEAMKLRILNGGHAIIAYPAGLLDIEFAHEAMAHPLIAAFLDKVLTDEVIPHVPPVPDTDLAAYHRLIAGRFANPEVGDTLRRLCFDGSNKQPKFIIPSLQDALRGGAPYAGLALLSAFWCRYCYGETESGATIEPNDPSWERLRTTAQRARETPAAWLEMSDIYGDVSKNPAMISAFGGWLNLVWSEGTAAALGAYLDGGG